MDRDTDLQQHKPKWLSKLERESWQAELIISGAAIIGSLQLPGLIDRMEIYFLLNYDRDSLWISYVASIYWRVLANSLIVTFIFHFIVRALWIGLVGLNSVFPGGFQANERYSRHYQERLRAEYGDVDGFIQRLDRLGSGIFGVAFSAAGMFFNLGIVGLVLVLLHSWLISLGLNSSQVLVGLGIFIIPVFLLSVIIMISHNKRFQDTAIAKRFQWPVSLAVSRLTYPVGRRYITTAANLVSSFYADRKAFNFSYLIGLAVIMIVVMLSLLMNEKTPLFVDDYYHRVAKDSLLLTTEYTGDDTYDGIYVRPLLADGGAPTADGMTVWIPLPERELVFLEAGCSLPEVSDTLSRAEERMLRRRWLVACGKEYISLSLNGQSIGEFDLERQYMANGSGEQYGMRAFIPDPPLREGKNLLLVTTQYPQEDTGEPRMAYLPFYHY